jgi:tetratricopeptide (TPR) repeat protein
MSLSNKFVKEGNGHYDNRNYTEALKSAEEALKINKKDKLAWLLKGRSLREIGRYHSAIKCFNESIKIDDRFDDAFLASCAAYLALHDYKKADNCADDALKIHRNSPYALNWKGFVNYREKRYSTAISYYERATRLLKGKKIANIWYNKGLVYLALKRNNEAVECFATAFHLDKNDAGSKMGMVKFFLENKDNERADKNLAEALNIDPDYVYAYWISCGVSMIQKGEYNEATNYFDKAIAPGSFFKPLALINKGLIYLNGSKYNESIEYFNLALNEKFNYYSALALICKCRALYKLNSLHEAEDCYHSALQLNKDLDFADSNDLIYRSLVGVLVFFDAYDLGIVEKLINELHEIAKE